MNLDYEIEKLHFKTILIFLTDYGNYY